MATLVRNFARGAMTVREFENLSDELASRDKAVWQCKMFAWYRYDDFRTERMVGPWKLNRGQRRQWASWVLFLMTSSAEYDAPDLTPSLIPLALPFAVWAISGFNPVALGVSMGALYLVGRFELVLRVAAVFGVKDSRGDYWPFPSQSERDRSVALANPFVSQ
jgi:hypothetical protein